METRKMTKNFPEYGVDAADLERGYTIETGGISPSSERNRKMADRGLAADESQHGGFLGRSNSGMER